MISGESFFEIIHFQRYYSRNYSFSRCKELKIPKWSIIVIFLVQFIMFSEAATSALPLKRRRPAEKNANKVGCKVEKGSVLRVASNKMY